MSWWQERKERLRKLGEDADEAARRELMRLKLRQGEPIPPLDPECEARLRLGMKKWSLCGDEPIINPEIRFEAIELLGEQHFWDLVSFIDIGPNTSWERRNETRARLSRSMSHLEAEAFTTWVVLKCDAVVAELRRVFKKPWRMIEGFEGASWFDYQFDFIEHYVERGLVSSGQKRYEEAMSDIAAWVKEVTFEQPEGEHLFWALHEFMPSVDDMIWGKAEAWQREALRIDGKIGETRVKRIDREKVAVALMMVHRGEFEAAKKKSRTVIRIVNSSVKKRTMSQGMRKDILWIFDNLPFILGETEVKKNRSRLPVPSRGRNAGLSFRKQQTAMKQRFQQDMLNLLREHAPGSSEADVERFLDSFKGFARWRPCYKKDIRKEIFKEFQNDGQKPAS